MGKSKFAKTCVVKGSIRFRPVVHTCRAEEARATGMDHMSCGLIHRPRLFEVFDSGQYYQIDGWYVLVDGKTKEMLDVLVMNQTQADERNKGLKEFGLSWSRTDSSVAAKIKPISRRKHQLSI